MQTLEMLEPLAETRRVKRERDGGGRRGNVVEQLDQQQQQRGAGLAGLGWAGLGSRWDMNGLVEICGRGGGGCLLVAMVRRASVSDTRIREGKLALDRRWSGGCPLLH